ncbi:class I adenylate-forming enzyme family protein [Streptomyces diastatochromogenes]|uniref:AMP-dependent synthetase n=1 Tax=Streptomyces diastatochromogenes TaxID=42236 RepID=A0A233S1L0_STRDA|nr:long-chain fatty acid--CoA ligase [Streptomyces diastatochromogenes]OXY89552.1 AMP-dependent synthetase [Streptomyces diastatochromogenes]
MHFSELPDVRAERFPDGPCIADDTSALNNSQFLSRVDGTARVLRDQGVGQGDVVAIVLPNGVDFVVTLFAAWRLGAAVTPVNPMLTAVEADYQIRDSGARAVVTDALSPQEVSGDRLLTPVVNADDVALLIYTSGSTGRPKGVILDHANVMAMVAMMTEACGTSAADHSLLVLPLFHVNGIVVSVLTPLHAGGRVTVAGRFRPETFFDTVERARPTFFSGVPAIFMMLTELPEDVRPDCSSLRFAVCGAAPMPARLIERFEARYGVPVVEGYGLSETSCAATVNPVDGRRKPGTVGLPLPGQEVAVVRPDGSPAAPGEAGEVVVSGPNVMRGYLGRPEDTARTLVDGRLHTGDVGRFDEDGYLVLVDRIKDMIIRGGENIYPKEIESVLGTHPAVLESAVVGAPDPRLGEVPVAYVVLRRGAAATGEQLIDHCRTALARYKLPVEIVELDALPRNPVGKTDKPALRVRLAGAVAAR